MLFLPAALRAAQAAGIQFTQMPILRFFAPIGATTSGRTTKTENFTQI